MDERNSRIGLIGIVVRDRTSATAINDILSRHGDVIIGRLGLPGHDSGTAIIVIVVEADNNRIGAISGSLGNVPGVTLRSSMLV